MALPAPSAGLACFAAAAPCRGKKKGTRAFSGPELWRCASSASPISTLLILRDLLRVSRPEREASLVHVGVNRQQLADVHEIQGVEHEAWGGGDLHVAAVAGESLVQADQDADAVAGDVVE